MRINVQDQVAETPARERFEDLEHDGLRAGFVASLARFPDAVALSIGARKWTYAELDAVARRWATLLTEASGGRPARVGVFAYRSLTAYVGILAALYAGAAFVPLNRKFPIERTRYMLDQGEIDVLIVDQASAPQLQELSVGLAGFPPILYPEAEDAVGRCFGRRACESAEELRLLPPVRPEDHAYLLFTSGSTGRPKGVPISHRNARAFIDFNAERYALGPADRLSQTFDLTFDLSIFDLFMAWQAGAAVCVLQPIELLMPFRSIEQHGITTWFSVPSVATHLIRNGLLKPNSMPGLRWSLFCGEALPRGVAEAWQAAAPNSVLENLYGPTELTIACAAYRWDSVKSPSECAQDLVPIGHPYAHMSSVLIDPDTRDDVPEGEVGELCMAGDQMFEGYWRSPELDVARFVERPVAGRRIRHYRTGDLVRKGPGGIYQFVGRADQQVKIGGYRVELGEIEAALRLAGCTDAVALLCASAQSTDAVLQTVVTGPRIDADRLLEAMRIALPAYMVPAAIHVANALPLNTSGKVDRNAIAAALARGEPISA
ncbi:MAG: D-alanine--poly(phosphoribitol) ligase [Lysobacteraceae bacterium]|nr:MAG: D-alanine--poly(phosphoribitol) ligase [Xanthomonadaceae bacterium]